MKFKVIDLFAGIGGIRRAFVSQGCECVFSSEIDKYARETYEANWKEVPSGDIRLIKSQEIPAFDILLAGFPCQPFSNAGKRKGFNDNRGDLFFEVARILRECSPKAFLLENVKGLLSNNKGETFKVMLDTLKQLGYKVFYQVLNARDFGVPQNRNRVIIVGFKNSEVQFNFPKPFSKPVSLKEILFNNDTVNPKYTLSDNLWASLQRRKELHKQKGNGFGYSLFDENSLYANTISARYYKDGSEILIKQENKNPRKLTPREAARLQGYRDDFKIVVSDTQAYKQFGNSVPTLMIEAVAKEMLKSMKKIWKK